MGKTHFGRVGFLSLLHTIKCYRLILLLVAANSWTLKLWNCNSWHNTNTFVDKGKGGTAPTGYKKIRHHMVNDVKHDGCHKSQLVASGNLTDLNTETVYSGVVSLRGIWLITLFSHLHELELWGTDVDIAYLEETTKEKVYIVGGPEFGDLIVHTLVICKKIYGLRSSDLHWNQLYANGLRSFVFVYASQKLTFGSV
jgi:hypothetical protein